MVSVPSEPTNAPVRSYRPAHVRPPIQTTLAIREYELDAEDVVRRGAVREAVRPPAFSATLPPIVHARWLDGSGVATRPYSATAG